VGLRCLNKLEPNLVYVRYWDHILFRNSDPNLYKPVLRECVGWILKENEEAVWLLWDRSVKSLPQERSNPNESGLVILKSEILEMKKLESPTQ